MEKPKKRVKYYSGRGIEIYRSAMKFSKQDELGMAFLWHGNNGNE
jgi:hypothetical protein